VDSFKEDTHYHTDFAAGPDRLVNTTTKLTSVVFLNEDYDGGELEIWGDKVESKIGRIVIFPSFAAHKVLQFSKKDRKMLITFIEGNTFK
jgi:predicted 2-oxoglutarate/Fe(II)-dependent dioxygenase YbiX